MITGSLRADQWANRRFESRSWRAQTATIWRINQHLRRVLSLLKVTSAFFWWVALLSAQAVPNSVMEILSTMHDAAGNVVAHVRNTGVKTITAWEIKQPSWTTPSWVESRLVPGEAKDGPNSWSPRSDDGTVPLVLAVVFEDGTSIGDPEAVKEIFDRRQGAADEYSYWMKMLINVGRERFTKELANHRGTNTSDDRVVVRNAYEVGASISVAAIRSALAGPEGRTDTRLRQFLTDKVKQSQMDARSEK